MAFIAGCIAYKSAIFIIESMFVWLLGLERLKPMDWYFTNDTKDSVTNCAALFLSDKKFDANVLSKYIRAHYERGLIPRGRKTLVEIFGNEYY